MAYHHKDDPGFSKWREEVEKQAKDNADLKAKLAEMDNQIKKLEGTPKDPGYLPPGVPPEVALAPTVLAQRNRKNRFSDLPQVDQVDGMTSMGKC